MTNISDLAENVQSAIMDMAWAIEARITGEPVCKDVPPEPYYTDMAHAAWEALVARRDEQ